MPECKECGAFTSDERRNLEKGIFPCRKCGANLNAMLAEENEKKMTSKERRKQVETVMLPNPSEDEEEIVPPVRVTPKAATVSKQPESSVYLESKPKVETQETNPLYVESTPKTAQTPPESPESPETAPETPETPTPPAPTPQGANITSAANVGTTGGAVESGYSSVTVTTGDFSAKYVVLGPIFFQGNSKEEVFADLVEEIHQRLNTMDDSEQWEKKYGVWGMEQSDYEIAMVVSVEELKKRATMLGGTAIIGMTSNIQMEADNSFHVQMSGTAIRFL